MHRLVVPLLAAFDAFIVVVAGVAAVAAPATLTWILAFGDTADWLALWPTTVTIWQLGHSVPSTVTLPGEYLAATGISPDAATFMLSLAPLAFAGFTAIFAARSGARSARAGSPIAAVVTGIVVFVALAIVLAVTSVNAVAVSPPVVSVIVPTLWFAIPALAGTVVVQWREATAGTVAYLRQWTQDAPPGWGAIPAAAVRGAAVVFAGLFAAGASLVTLALIVRGGDVIALYQAGNNDALGATVVTLGGLAYLPTLIVWAIAFLAGPGISMGAAGVVSPAGTTVGVIPPLPLLGAIPESTTTWWLLLTLIPVALGAGAGWLARPEVAELSSRARDEDSSSIVRATTAIAIAVLSAAATAALCACARGSAGPGALANVGPDPGPVALLVGLEVLLGAGILLLAPDVTRKPG